MGKDIAKVPVWAWHGDKDNVIKASRSVDMIEAMKALKSHKKLWSKSHIESNSIVFYIKG